MELSCTSRKVTSLFVIALVMFITSTGLAFDTSGISKRDLAKAKRYSGQYIRTVDQVENYLNRKSMRNAKKKLKSAEKIYNRIVEAYRSHPDLIKYRSKYENLKKKAYGNVPTTESSNFSSGLNKRDLKKAKRYAARFEKKMKEAKRFFDEGKMYICEKRLTDANKLYGKIHDAYKNNPGVQGNRKKYDEMNQIVKSKIANRKAAIDNRYKLSIASSGFGSDVRKLSRLLNSLIRGKENKTSTTLLELKNLKDSFSALDSFYADCQGKYRMVIKEKPNKKYEGMSAKYIYDLVQNRVKYRDKYIKKTSEETLDSLIKGLASVNQKILRNNTIYTVDLAKLKSNDFLSEYTAIAKIKDLYSWIGAPLPTGKLREIQNFQQKQKASIKKVKNKLKFNQSDYSYKTDAMRDAAKRNAKSRKMQLVYVGMKANRWIIVKNTLGIPLYKTATGRGLYKVSGEDFYRGFDVTVTKHFNGSGYDPIASVRAKSKVTIYRK